AGVRSPGPFFVADAQNRLPLFGQVPAPDLPRRAKPLIAKAIRLGILRASLASGMLKITLHDYQASMLFVLEGRLCGPWVGELRQCWQTAASTLHSRTATVDLKEVDFVDSEGQALLAEMQKAGVRLRAGSPLIRALLPREYAIRGEQSGCATVEEKPTRRRHACPHSDVTKPNSGSV
ncbi:MAG: hypothetical protein ABSH45_17540, partial [Bryobacteraceae bacterium]